MKKNNIFQNILDVFRVIGRALKNAFVRAFFGTHKELSILEEEAVQSPLKVTVKKFFRNRLSNIGLIVFLFVLIFCFIGSLFVKADLSYLNSSQKNISPGFGMMSVPNDLKNNGILDIAVGASYSMGIDKDNNVYIWGQNINDIAETFPQGQGAPEDLKTGKEIVKGLKAKRVWAGQNHFVLEKLDGSLVSFGLKTDTVSFGLTSVPTNLQIGLSAKFVNVEQAIRLDGGVLDVAAFNQLTLVITKANKVYMWGNTSTRSNNFNTIKDNKPIAAGFTRSDIAFLNEDGTVVVMGEGSIKRMPEGLDHVVKLVTTAGSAVALKDDGTIIAWGDNLSHELEFDPSIQGHITNIIDSANGSDNYQHLSVILDDGSVYSWGSNKYDAGVTTKKLATTTEASQVFSGYFQNYVIDKDGKLLGTYGLKGHIFGTDNFGRDVFERVMNGGRISLTIGLVAVLISTVIGVLIGGFAGYYGGKVDIFLMRVTEVFGSIPFLPIAMTFSAILNKTYPGLTTTDRMFMIMVILGVLSWTGLAQLIRAQILSEREKEFVTAAKALGVRNKAIIFKHIIPNVLTIIIINATLGYASSLLTESGLSFLGFGVQLPAPSWGNMLTGAQDMAVIKTFWWRWVFPSFFLCLATISINIIGDGIRDAVDPRSNER